MLDNFLRHLDALGLAPGARAIVAVSGGPDSVALLDLLVRGVEGHGLYLVVGHVDHGIHPDSGRVAAEVERQAGSYGLRCLTARLGLGADAGETLSREARYAALEAMREAESARYVMTAHHADDQAETVLIRLLHGTGPAGLAGMAARRGNIVRPLLLFTRDEIRGYFERRGLAGWDDPANRDARHLRSWVRHAVLPLLGQRLPGVSGALREVAAQAADDRRAWDLVIDALGEVDWRTDRGEGSVAAAPFARYDSTFAQALVRAIIRRLGGTIGRDQAGRAARFMATAASGQRFEAGGGWILEAAFGRIDFVPTSQCAAGGAGAPLTMDGDEGDGVLGRWRLCWRREPALPVQDRDGLTAWFSPAPLAARAFRAGDRVHPLGGPGHRLVVRCLQDARVARRDRESWPVLVDEGGDVVWVPGICRSNRLVPPPGAEALRVDAQVV